jgi:uncharacterized protein (DUF1330 family)
MAKGYIIVTEDVTDPAAFAAYAGEAAKAMRDGVTVLCFDPKPEVLEGDWHGPQTIILEFESVDAARDWYNSELYQKAAGMRQAAADCKAVIVSGR